MAVRLILFRTILGAGGEGQLDPILSILLSSRRKANKPSLGVRSHSFSIGLVAFRQLSLCLMPKWHVSTWRCVWVATKKDFVKHPLRASLVVLWLGIRLPMQRTQVRAQVREDPTCRGATKPVRHNYWARVPQLLEPVHLEPVLRNKRSHCSEKPEHRNERVAPAHAARESPCTATKTQRSQK